MKEPKTKTENVGSPDPVAPAAQAAPAASSVPESPEVSAASAENKRRQRKDALDEASLKLGVGVRNSVDAVATWCVQDKPELIAQHYKLLIARLREVHALLKDHIQIENLPEL